MRIEGTVLDLPQCRAVLSPLTPGPVSLRLLVLGGRRPSPAWLRAMAEGREVWCADSGADACREAGVLPSRLIGDLDSISEEGRIWAEAHGVLMDRYPAEKDETDFQLALRTAEGPLLVTGCWGGRFDHALSNIFSASLGDAPVPCLADEREVLFPLPEGKTLRLELPSPPLALSLLPMTARARVTAWGVRWPLEDAILTQSHPYAVSNLPGREAGVAVAEGVVGVYLLWDGSAP